MNAREKLLNDIAMEIQGAEDPEWSGGSTITPERAQEAAQSILELIQESGEQSDGFHTFRELYEARMLYHAHAVRMWTDAGVHVVKSERHSDGELCFGGGWFIVVSEIPGGQISQHYRMVDWDLFECQAVDLPPEFDGHTTQDVHQRLRGALGIEES